MRSSVKIKAAEPYRFLQFDRVMNTDQPAEFLLKILPVPQHIRQLLIRLDALETAFSADLIQIRLAPRVHGVVLSAPLRKALQYLWKRIGLRHHLRRNPGQLFIPGQNHLTVQRLHILAEGPDFLVPLIQHDRADLNGLKFENRPLLHIFRSNRMHLQIHKNSIHLSTFSAPEDRFPPQWQGPASSAFHHRIVP